MTTDLVKKGLAAKRESKHVEFKELFDPTSAEAWCELVKDIVAIANSGGGVIIVGLTSRGAYSRQEVTQVLELDPATFTDKIAKYTGTQFDGTEIVECRKGNHTLAALVISQAATPMVFERPGTYDVGEGKQRMAFAKGTVYFRHGAKSEPGTTGDLRKVLDRELESIRRKWVASVRRVVGAPPGARVQILPAEVMQSDARGATRIRIVDDQSAPAYRVIDPDKEYEYRQKELIAQVNKRLPKGVSMNTYDVLAVRSVHGIQGQRRYCYKPKFGSLQYNDAFVDWLITRYREDHNFFNEARKRFSSMRTSD